MVTAELFPHRPGHMQSLRVQVGADKITITVQVETPRPRWSDDFTRSWKWCRQLAKFCGDYSTRETNSNFWHCKNRITSRCTMLNSCMQVKCGFLISTDLCIFQIVNLHLCTLPDYVWNKNAVPGHPEPNTEFHWLHIGKTAVTPQLEISKVSTGCLMLEP